jgi:hypothetical protein
LVGSIHATANIYNTSTNAGYFAWNDTSQFALWTPHLPTLAHSGGDPNMWPGMFSDSTLSVICTPRVPSGTDFPSIYLCRILSSRWAQWLELSTADRTHRFES